MALSQKTVEHRYSGTVPVRGPNGRKVLKGLPKRESGEIGRIKQILSSHKCRACASCCRGFTFSKKEPHFESIMERVKGDRKLFAKRRVGAGVYEVYPGKGKNACGFLTWEGGKVMIDTLGDEEIRKKGEPQFGCQIYDARASICSTYPFTGAWLDDRHEPNRREAGMIILHWSCQAIGELVEDGVGHLTESELLSFGQDSEGRDMLSALAGSLKVVKGNLSRETLHTHAFHSEEGERVYPINLRSIVPVRQ
ncbi:MAG: YkgJ family cysteine cluster protein [bacterium]|nr:YkgJ family cysteine cluster protein [bacterium]